MSVNIETPDQAKAIIASTLGIPLEYRDLNSDDLVSARDRAEALLQSVELLEKNPTLTAEISINGEVFNIVTDKFKTPAEAASFFIENNSFFIHEIKDENGKVV